MKKLFILFMLSIFGANTFASGYTIEKHWEETKVTAIWHLIFVRDKNGKEIKRYGFYDNFYITRYYLQYQDGDDEIIQEVDRGEYESSIYCGYYIGEVP